MLGHNVASLKIGRGTDIGIERTAKYSATNGSSSREAKNPLEVQRACHGATKNKVLTDVPSEKSTATLSSSVESAPKDPQNSTHNALPVSQRITNGILGSFVRTPIALPS